MLMTEEDAERQPLLDADPIPQHQANGKPNIVRFDPNGDPDNPLEWSTRYRWGITFLLAFMAFTV